MTFLYADEAVFKLYNFIYEFVSKYGKSEYADGGYKEIHELFIIFGKGGKAIINRCLTKYKDLNELKKCDMDLFKNLLREGCKLQNLKRSGLSVMPEDLFFETDETGKRRVVHLKEITKKTYNSKTNKYEDTVVGYKKEEFNDISPLEIDLLNLAQYFVREVRGVKMYKNKYNQFIEDLHNDGDENANVLIDVIDANNIIMADSDSDEQGKDKNFCNFDTMKDYSTKNLVLSPIIHNGNGENNLNAIKEHYGYMANVIVKNFIDKVNKNTGCCDYLIVPGTGFWGNTGANIIEAYRNACIKYLGKEDGKRFFNNKILFCCHSDEVGVIGYSYNCFETETDATNKKCHYYNKFINVTTGKKINLKGSKLTLVNAGDPLMQIAGEGIEAQINQKGSFCNLSFDTLFASTNYHQTAGTIKSGKYKLRSYENKDKKKSIITIFDDEDIIFKNSINFNIPEDFKIVNIDDINLNFQDSKQKNENIPTIHLNNFIALNDTKEKNNNLNGNDIDNILTLQKQIKQIQKKKIGKQLKPTEEKEAYIVLGKDIQILSYIFNSYFEKKQELFITNNYKINIVKDQIKEMVMDNSEISSVSSKVIKNLDLIMDNMINAFVKDYNSYKNKNDYFEGKRNFDLFKQTKMLPIFLESIGIYDDKYLDFIYEGIEKKASEKSNGEQFVVPFIIYDNKEFIRGIIKNNNDKRNLRNQNKEKLYKEYKQLGRDIQTVSSLINSKIYKLNDGFFSFGSFDFAKEIRENIEKCVSSKRILDRLSSIIVATVNRIKTDFEIYKKKKGKDYKVGEFFKDDNGFNECKQGLLPVYLHKIGDKRASKYLSEIYNGIEEKAQEQCKDMNCNYDVPYIINDDIKDMRKKIADYNSKNLSK